MLIFSVGGYWPEYLMDVLDIDKEYIYFDLMRTDMHHYSHHCANKKWCRFDRRSSGFDIHNGEFWTHTDNLSDISIRVCATIVKYLDEIECEITVNNIFKEV